MRHRLAASDPLDQFPAPCRWGDAELALKPRAVGLVRGERTGPIARCREPAHQPALSLLREGVEGHLLPGAVQGRIEIPGALGLLRQLAEHTEQPMAMVLARLVHPVVVQVREQVTPAKGRGLQELPA